MEFYLLRSDSPQLFEYKSDIFKSRSANSSDSGYASLGPSPTGADMGDSDTDDFITSGEAEPSINWPFNQARYKRDKYNGMEPLSCPVEGCDVSFAPGRKDNRMKHVRFSHPDYPLQASSRETRKRKPNADHELKTLSAAPNRSPTNSLARYSDNEASTTGAITEAASTQGASTERASTEEASTEEASTEGASTDSASTRNPSTGLSSLESGSTDSGSTDSDMSDDSATPSPERDAWFTIVYAKHRIMVSLMTVVYAAFDLQRNANVRKCTGSGAAGGGANLQNSSSQSSSSSRSCKRKSSGEDSPFPGGNIEKKRRTESPASANDGRNRSFACPFYKFDSRKYCSNSVTGAKYRTCGGPGFARIKDVKQHLKKKHTAPVHCPRCWRVVESGDQLAVHLNADERCEQGEPQVLEGVDQNKMRMIGKWGISWERIYEILFPGAPIPSPYYEAYGLTSETLARSSPGSREYEAYIQSNLPGMVEAHLRAHIDPQVAIIGESVRAVLVDIVRTCYSTLARDYRLFNAPISSANDRIQPSLRATASNETTVHTREEPAPLLSDDIMGSSPDAFPESSLFDFEADALLHIPTHTHYNTIGDQNQSSNSSYVNLLAPMTAPNSANDRTQSPLQATAPTVATVPVALGPVRVHENDTLARAFRSPFHSSTRASASPQSPMYDHERGTRYESQFLGLGDLFGPEPLPLLESLDSDRSQSVFQAMSPKRTTVNELSEPARSNVNSNIDKALNTNRAPFNISPEIDGSTGQSSSGLIRQSSSIGRQSAPTEGCRCSCHNCSNTWKSKNGRSSCQACASSHNSFDDFEFDIDFSPFLN